MLVTNNMLPFTHTQRYTAVTQNLSGDLASCPHKVCSVAGLLLRATWRRCLLPLIMWQTIFYYFWLYFFCVKRSNAPIFVYIYRMEMNILVASGAICSSVQTCWGHEFMITPFSLEDGCVLVITSLHQPCGVGFSTTNSCNGPPLILCINIKTFYYNLLLVCMIYIVSQSVVAL